MPKQYGSSSPLTSHHPLPCPMWCTSCQQDVPAIAGNDMPRCAQCGRFLKRRVETFSTATESATNHTPAATIQSISTLPTDSLDEPADDWLLQQQVRHLQRRLHLAAPSPPAPTLLSEFAAATAPHSAPRLISTNPAARTIHLTTILAWTMIALGSLAFLGGAALLAWWFSDRSAELWNFGIASILTGQFGLLFGLVLQLNNLRNLNRRTTATLENAAQHWQQTSSTSGLLSAAPYAFTHPSRIPATHSSHF